MCNKSCIEFYQRVIKPNEVSGKKILEVGSANLNGGLRSYLENLSPIEYIGVDIQEAPGVDIVLRAEDFVKHFGENKFDFVVSTEVLEHIADWITVINNLKKIVSPNGVILLTTRSIGFPYHGFPNDYWRFEVKDMQRIFADFDIIALESDQSEPGVFIKAIKPSQNPQVSSALDNYKLWSIITGKRESAYFANNFIASPPPLKRIDYQLNRLFARLFASLKRKIAILLKLVIS
jgi:SAM-dependent methyltransferase